MTTFPRVALPAVLPKYTLPPLTVSVPVCVLLPARTKTLPPVFLPEWPCSESQGTRFTSVMRWQGFKEVTHNGVTYGQRDKEFENFKRSLTAIGMIK